MEPSWLKKPTLKEARQAKPPERTPLLKNKAPYGDILAPKSERDYGAPSPRARRRVPSWLEKPFSGPSWLEQPLGPPPSRVSNRAFTAAHRGHSGSCPAVSAGLFLPRPLLATGMLACGGLPRLRGRGAGSDLHGLSLRQRCNLRCLALQAADRRALADFTCFRSLAPRKEWRAAGSQSRKVPLALSPSGRGHLLTAAVHTPSHIATAVSFEAKEVTALLVAIGTRSAPAASFARKST